MNEEEAAGRWLDPDELPVVQAFLDAGVRFLIVGGRAVQFHGYERPAKDLNLLVELSAENWPKLRTALRSLNQDVPPFEDLCPQGSFHGQFRFYPTVEILTAINGVSFPEAWTKSDEGTFEGLQVRVLSKGYLIRSKWHTGRPADANDVRALLENDPNDAELPA